MLLRRELFSERDLLRDLTFDFFTFCLLSSLLLLSPLFSPRLVSSRLLLSPLVSSHFFSSPLLSSHLLSSCLLRDTHVRLCLPLSSPLLSRAYFACQLKSHVVGEEEGDAFDRISRGHEAGEEEGDTFEEEYPLEDLGISTSDFIAKVAVPDFRRTRITKDH